MSFGIFPHLCIDIHTQHLLPALSHTSYRVIIPGDLVAHFYVEHTVYQPLERPSHTESLDNRNQDARLSIPTPAFFALF